MRETAMGVPHLIDHYTLLLNFSHGRIFSVSPFSDCGIQEKLDIFLGSGVRFQSQCMSDWAGQKRQCLSSHPKVVLILVVS